MVKRIFICWVLLFFVSACGGSPSSPDAAVDEPVAQSAFLTPQSDGTFGNKSTMGATANTYHFTNADGDGYAYSIGPLATAGFGAISGIMPSTLVSEQPDTGTIDFDAIFIVDALVDIREVDGTIRAISGIGSNDNITLQADFGENTLTGSTPQFEVNGILAGSGTGLSGTVRWLNVEGQLTGRVGSDQVIGAFHGNADDIVFAGGFIGEAITP